MGMEAPNHRLDQGWSVAGAGANDRFSCCQVDLDGIHAVDPDAGHVVSQGAISNALDAHL